MKHTITQSINKRIKDTTRKLNNPNITAEEATFYNGVIFGLNTALQYTENFHHRNATAKMRGKQ